jgi:tetratricopeptide (TPR) repeat protein
MSKKQKKKAQTSKAAPAAAAPQKNSQILPSKEQTHWKRVLKHYERKEYKKVIKAADMILKNFPMHGETLAMKGLTLNCLKRKEEARKLVKMGLAMNLKSYVCWHVYGLLYRSDHMYDDAIKCYQNALLQDKDNEQILKDLANLQIQRRELQGFQETRRKLLLQKKNNRSNWIAYGIGAHLCGQYKKCINILNSFIKTQKDADGRTSKYEISEIQIYKNIVMTESGDVEGAIAHLDEVESKVVDKIYLHERKGELLLKAGKKDEAEAQYRKLLNINCENYSYHYGLMQSLGLATDGNFADLTDEARGKLSELYKSLKSEYGD